MRRRIDVGSPLPDVAELIDVESVLGDRVERAHLHLAEALPVRRVGTERVRQVGENPRGDRCINDHPVRLQSRLVATYRRVTSARTLASRTAHPPRTAMSRASTGATLRHCLTPAA